MSKVGEMTDPGQKKGTALKGEQQATDQDLPKKRGYEVNKDLNRVIERLEETDIGNRKRKKDPEVTEKMQVNDVH